jgi:hypothetical protein
MANYVLVYTDGNTPAEPAERDAVMAAWVAWFANLGEAVVDSGNPFGPSVSVAPDGNVGTGARSGLTGYSVLKADSLAAAAELAKGCPHLKSSGTIEVYETFQVM